MSQSSDGKNVSNLFAGESFGNFRLGEDIGRPVLAQEAWRAVAEGSLRAGHSRGSYQ